jgi:hypothetical protein
MDNGKTAVITAYGHDKVIDKIAVNLFESSMIGYTGYRDDSNAIAYCESINSPESPGVEWAFAKIVSENTQYEIGEFLPLKFNVLLKLDNVTIQRVLMKVNSKDLALALKNTTNETTGKIREKIFENMTKTAIQILEEDMVSMGPVQLRDVIQAQEKILNIIIDLNRAYQIVIPDSRGGTPE